MRLDFCVACGERDPEALEHHHLVPRTAGGGDEDQNLITLCHGCHGRAHGYERANTRALTRKGLATARARLAALSKEERAARLANRVQLTSDGHRAYLEAVEGAFGADVDYAQIVKLYGSAPGPAGRYSLSAGVEYSPHRGFENSPIPRRRCPA